MAEVPHNQQAGAPHRAQPPSGRAMVHGKVAHRTAGRVRLQFESHGNHADLKHLQSHLRKAPGVRDVQFHPRTRSIVVHHNPADATFPEQLAKLISDTGLFLLRDGEDPQAGSERLTAVEHDLGYLVDHSKSGQVILRHAEHLNRAVKHATDGWVDLRFLLPASIGLCALIFIEVETAPLWVPLALFSFQSFNNLHQPRPAQPQDVADMADQVAKGQDLSAAPYPATSTRQPAGASEISATKQNNSGKSTESKSADRSRRRSSKTTMIPSKPDGADGASGGAAKP